LRPHTKYGTLELRVADVQTRVEDATAIAGVFQCLVAFLGRRLDARVEQRVHASVRIEENAWRAMRYGIRGMMVDLDTGEAESTGGRLSRLLEQLEPFAHELGNLDALHAAQLLMADNGAERQRYVGAQRGLYGLTRWLADEIVASAHEYLSRRA
jgi:glutamate---cysteine ligase / carboxylate-amine ligase